MKRWTESDWYFPPDLIVLIGFPVFGLCAGFFLPWFTTVRHGNPTPFYASLLLACLGIVLLFFAKLPLYRQKKFFTFGARHLTGIHRKLYRLAYMSIGISIVLLLLVIAMTRYSPDANYHSSPLTCPQDPRSNNPQGSPRNAPNTSQWLKSWLREGQEVSPPNDPPH